ncbi:MAG: 2-hydroxyhepta-2,4-diene-1,7-dioate isomerase [Crocinitomicaceae bacterium]|nr:2-hydroxyhepta-2,4-diene-1,7-dioate isomerase [Crocinitomicaceae bacterium]|tara:strand:- start:64080 stop:64691 length:612 start_codon:yes stop_codon:yes gene_type:complete
MKLICIGRNYFKHAIEMNEEVPEKPIFFMKPETSLFNAENPFFYPDFSKKIEFECELVIKIDRVGKNIKEKFAHKYYSEIGLGIDFTARDLQTKCKKNSHPWEISKSFDNSAPISKEFINKEKLNLDNISFQLNKNGKTVQKGNSSEMIFKIDSLISYISKFITLKKGDLIFTGTPEGVGPIKIGDQLTGLIENKVMFNLKIK